MTSNLTSSSPSSTLTSSPTPTTPTKLSSANDSSSITTSLTSENYVFPLGTFVGITATMFSYFFAINVIFPFVPFMVHDFYPHASKSDLGYYVGYLDSAFFTGSVLAAVVWSRLSDIYGRKPIIMLGLGGSIIATLLFGLSLNFGMALFTRFIWGSLDGNMGVCKTILGEISNKQNQSKIYSVIGVVAGVGRLIGNMIGGWLVLFHPINKFKYFMPCALSALFAMMAVIIVWKYAQETLYSKRTFNTNNNRTVTNETKKNNYTKFKKSNKAFDKNKNNINDSLVEMLPTDSLNTNENIIKMSSDNNDIKDISQTQDSKITEKKENIYLQVMRISTVRTAVFYYSTLGFINTSFNATVPLWLLLHKRDHGFNYKAHNIGTIFAFSAPIFLVSQVSFFHPLVTRFGYLNMAKVCSISYGVLLMILPHFAYFNKYNRLVSMSILIVYIGLMLSVVCMAFTISWTLLNNCTDDEKRAVTNGFGQSVVSILRFLSPIVMCNLFSFSAKTDYNQLFNYSFVFYLQGLLSIFCAFYIIIMLPKDFEEKISLKKINKNKIKNDKNYKTLENSNEGNYNTTNEKDEINHSIIDFSMG